MKNQKLPSGTSASKIALCLPTPQYELEYFQGNGIFIKRDDLTGAALGGNKTRKAALFFEEAHRLGATCIVTYGSAHSNHCRVVANFARAQGLQCIVVTTDPESAGGNNRTLCRHFGVRFVICAQDKVKETLDASMDALYRAGERAYFIPGGGHGPLGTQSYIEAYEEIRAAGIPFDFIFFASGTGTTQAGLMLGQAMNAEKTAPRILGISIARNQERGVGAIKESLEAYQRTHHGALQQTAPIEFIDDLFPFGYGQWDEGILKTMDELLVRHGLPTDPVYTAKAYEGMRRYLIRERIQGARCLFLHTGSTPLFFDHLGELR
ncbi:D-cysteine desulfhydrase [Clostridiaceae bacterium JG1575]|nr:D-cysteine desulfhydrase [Clostridiaceae bacterium JG1575]